MILVIGGAGYLGSCVVNELIAREKGHLVVVYDNLLYRDEYRKAVRFVNGDVTDHSMLKFYLNESSTVIWLAALVGDGVCMLDPARAKAVNQDAVQFLANNFDGEIIFSSTCSVYGYSDQEVDEHYPVKPLSIYAETKLAAESYLKNGGKDAVILRLGTLHGVSDRMRFDLVVNAMARSAHFHNKITVWGGAQRRPLLEVQDAAEAIVDLAVRDKWVSGTFNMAAENITVAEIAKRVAAEFGAELEMLEMPSEDQRDYSVSSKAAKEWFGFDPKRTIEQSVEMLRGLLESGRLKDPYSDIYNNQESYQPWGC